MSSRVLSVVAILGPVLLAQGCVYLGTMDLEKIPRHERDLRVPEAAPINVELRHDPPQGKEHFRKNFRKVSSEFPYLDDAAEKHPETSCTLGLHCELVRERYWPTRSCAELSGYSFTLFPCYTSDVWKYEVTWKNGSDEPLYAHEGRLKHRAMIQLWMVYAMPLNIITMPLSPTETKMMRRLLALIERDLARDGFVAAACRPPQTERARQEAPAVGDNARSTEEAALGR